MKNIAVVGTGYWGTNLVRNYYNLGVLKILCDSSLNIIEKLKKSYSDIHITNNYNDVLNDNEIKGVVIALPAELHFEFTEKALKKGKDVYVEKPLSLDLNQAERLIDLSEKRKQILMLKFG
jgi:UDP-2-acetamido-3-amino-2,3-dideoxy-glucuronate N-acetyltransferase